MEGGSNRHRRAESRQAADVLDRLGSRLQDLASSIDAYVCEPCHRRNARLLTKPTAQRPSRHMCPGREPAEVERTCKVLEHPVAKGAELVAARVGHEPFNELRLPSLTLWRSHEAAGPCVGCCGAEVAPDEVEAQVDTRGYASRREDVVVIDEEAVGQYVDLGVAVLELSGPPPMGGGGTVIEHTSRGERKSGGANRYQSGAPRVCRTYRVEHCRRDGRVGVFVSWDDQRVRAFESLEPCGGIDRQPRTRERRRATFSAYGQAVVRVATEDLRSDPELQWDNGR